MSVSKIAGIVGLTFMVLGLIPMVPAVLLMIDATTGTAQGGQRLHAMLYALVASLLLGIGSWLTKPPSRKSHDTNAEEDDSVEAAPCQLLSRIGLALGLILLAVAMIILLGPILLVLLAPVGP